MVLWNLFLVFFKVGLFTFGGGYAMIPLISQQVVAHGWMDGQDLVNFIAVSESTPGPFAVNIATYVGTQAAGFPGAVCATLGVVLPSFLIILLIAKGYEKFERSKIVAGMMSGLRPAVVGMIGSAVVSIGLQVFFPSGWKGIRTIATMSSSAFLVTLGIFLLAIILIFVKKVGPIKIIVLSAALGIAAGYAGLLG